jgi:hypothetical protein
VTYRIDQGQRGSGKKEVQDTMVHLTRRALSRLVVATLVLGLMLASFATASANDNAKIRVIHASPDAPAVDIWVNGERAITDLAFPEGTDYVELPAGEYRIQVTPAGAGADSVVIDATLPLGAGNAYTAMAVGEVAEIEALVLNDDSGVPADGQAHIRVVHASPDAPAVDIAVTGGDVLLSNLEFKEASAYTPVPAGSYDLDVRVAGTDTVALQLEDVNLQAGTVYTVVAVGFAGDGSLTVAAFGDTVMQTGTGGGAPAMPATGAGGTAATQGTSWALIAGLAVVALMLAGGTTALATRRARN